MSPMVSRRDDRHDAEELLELVKVDLARSVGVGHREHLRDRVLVGGGADLRDGGAQLAEVDVARAVGVDGVEDRAELVLGVRDAARAGGAGGRVVGEVDEDVEHLAALDPAAVDAEALERRLERARVGGEQRLGLVLRADRLWYVAARWAWGVGCGWLGEWVWVGVGGWAA